MRKCNKCGVTKNISEFGSKPTQCKQCVSLRVKEYNHRTGRVKRFKGEPKKDLTGMVFERLTVINRVKIEDKYQWLCKCECGNEVNVIHTNLVGSRIKSCGCKRKNEGKKNHLWKGYEEISGDYWCKVKHSAARRNLIFEIEIKYAWDLFIKQDKKCALTGTEIYFGLNQKQKYTASLDRIDSSKEYTEDNIQWVHKDINRMKNAYDQDYFIEMCTKVATKHPAIDEYA